MRMSTVSKIAYSLFMACAVVLFATIIFGALYNHYENRIKSLNIDEFSFRDPGFKEDGYQQFRNGNSYDISRWRVRTVGRKAPVFIVGASNAWGWGATSVDRAWWAQLDRPVVAYGVSGARLVRIAEWLRDGHIITEAKKYISGDIENRIIVLTGTNDSYMGNSSFDMWVQGASNIVHDCPQCILIGEPWIGCKKRTKKENAIFQKAWGGYGPQDMRLDITSVFDQDFVCAFAYNEQNIFTDQFHWNDEGHAIFGKMVSDYLDTRFGDK